MGPFSMGRVGLVLRLLLLAGPHPFASAYPIAHSPTAGGDRPLERLEEHSFRFCSDRLLQGIQRACNNPFASYAWGSNGRKRSSLPQDEGDNQAREGVSEEYLEVSTEAGAGGGRFGGRRDRNIVQACCRNSCTPSEFQRFCILSKFMTNRQKQQQEPPLTTSTTTPEPPKVSFHRFSFPKKRRRNERKGEEEIRAEKVLVTALSCVLNPSCSEQSARGRGQRSGLGRKCFRMSKEGSFVYPMLLRILSWGIPPSQEGEEDQQQQRRREESSRQENPHSRQRLNLHSARHRGGHGYGHGQGHRGLNRHSSRPQLGDDVILSGFRFGEPSFPERGVVVGGGYSGWVRGDDGEDATEAPANQTLGFPIGTHDGIQFNS